MRRIIFIILALINSHIGFSQYVQRNIQGQNSNATISNDGFLFFDRGNAFPALEVPALSNRFSIFTSALWLGAIRADGEQVSTAPIYCLGTTNCDVFPGPVSNDGGLEALGFDSEFNNIWPITLFEIQVHQLYFECLEDPECDITEEFPNGYSQSPWISNWPGNGPDLENYDSDLAPFVDYNDNGLYDPENGDYPDICGDAAFVILENDVLEAQGESGGLPVGVEVRTMVYVTYGIENELQGTYFVNQEIINRNNQDLNELYLGIWTDFDLGNYLDDYLASHVELNMLYAYNGDDFDESGGSSLGYGSDLPAQGVVLLKGPLADSDGEDNEMPFPGYDRYGPYFSGYGDGEIDNERLGFTSITQYMNGQGPFSLPDNDQEVYNVLQGLRSDGSLFFASDSGLAFGMTNVPSTKYIFPGDSDPELYATDGVQPDVNGETIWTEEAAANPPGDRKGVASIGPLTLGPNESIDIDYAYIFSRDSWSFDENESESLIAKIDDLQNYTCNLSDGVLSSSSIDVARRELVVYPNPASTQITFDLLRNGTVRIYSLDGKEQFSANVVVGANDLDVSSLSPGVYIIQIDDGFNRLTQKLVINQ